MNPKTVFYIFALTLPFAAWGYQVARGGDIMLDVAAAGEVRDTRTDGETRTCDSRRREVIFSLFFPNDLRCGFCKQNKSRGRPGSAN